MNAHGRSRASNVAVIVAAHQAALVLDAALASVAGQSEAPAEVVVVDDGSSDDTAAVARRWSNVLPLQVVRLASNRGPAFARRRAIQEAKSPLLALLDADDVWLPDHLRTVLGQHSGPRSIVSANAAAWIPGAGIQLVSYQQSTPVPTADRQGIEILRHNFVFCAALFSREPYEAVGGHRDEFDGAEDWDLWIRMIAAGCVVRAASGVTCLYRRAPGTLSTTPRAYEANLRVLKAAASLCTHAREQRAVRDSLREYRARLHLLHAYAASRTGARGSRLHAVKALGGPTPVAIRAAAMLVAPALVTSRRDRAAKVL